jgi:hypothetical protein
MNGLQGEGPRNRSSILSTKGDSLLLIPRVESLSEAHTASYLMGYFGPE